MTVGELIAELGQHEDQLEVLVETRGMTMEPYLAVGSVDYEEDREERAAIVLSLQLR